MLSFLSDDGTLADYLRLFPLLHAQQVPASIAVMSIVAKLDGHAPASLPPSMQMPYMNLEQLHTLQSVGWEILSHTRTHRDLCRLGQAELERELLGSKEELRTLGLEVGEALVYPYGRYNPAVMNVTSRHYRFAVIAAGGLNFGQLSPFQIRRVAFDCGNAAFYIGEVERAIAARAWLIFMLHPGLPQFDGAQQRHLAKVVEYARSRTIPIVTVGEALRRLGYTPQAESRELSEPTAVSL
jgi:peptidoglycan/xylan/chitin deacetylase (PgdA/CDA1 family)